MTNYIYCLTLTLAQPKFYSTYEKFISDFIFAYPTVQFSRHYEGTAGLHLHATINSPKKIGVTRVRKLPTLVAEKLKFSLKMEIMTGGWEGYVVKDHKKQFQLIQDEIQREMDLRCPPDTIESDEEEPDDISLSLKRLSQKENLFYKHELYSSLGLFDLSKEIPKNVLFSVHDTNFYLSKVGG